MNEQNYFEASWDGLVKGITGGTIVLVISIAMVLSMKLDRPFLASGFIVILVCILVLPFLWAPRGYAVESNDVVIKRLIGEMRIAAADQPRRWNWTWRGIRLWGSGGLYGYFGYFAFKGIGRVHMYATNRHNLVVIKDERSEKHLLSPDQPERFILLLGSHQLRQQSDEHAIQRSFPSHVK